MNCDEVFQYLASVRSASANGELERHLLACPSCRQMSELFKPVVDVLDTPSAEEPDAQVPARWQHLWDAVAIAERASEQLKDRQAPRMRPRSRMLGLLRYAALLMCGMLIGGAFVRAVASNARATGYGQDPRPTSETLIEHSPGTRCERLVAELRRATSSNSCPTCQRETARVKVNLVSLCLVCHSSRSETSLKRQPVSGILLSDLWHDCDVPTVDLASLL